MAKFMLATAIVLPALLGALLLRAQETIGPMYVDYPDPGPVAAITIGAGILAYVVGLATMIRIYRADPESHRSFWRSGRH
jgi:hypothetical protein